MRIDRLICVSTLLVTATWFIRAQTLPAPTIDRVGFPSGYQTSFTKLLTVDRPDNGQIRVIYGNSMAAFSLRLSVVIRELDAEAEYGRRLFVRWGWAPGPGHSGNHFRHAEGSWL